METANEIMKQVVPILMFPIKKYLRYIILCSEYVRLMDIKIKELNNVKVGAEEKMNSNRNNRLEVPARVEGWLGEVENINEKVENVSRDIDSCLNVKIRLRVGRNAFGINEEIDSVMRRYKEIDWPDHPIPPGKVDSNEAFTSTPSTTHNDFQSREVTFIEALKALGPDNKSHMIALCGMGGVGKTTMMQRLKKVVQEQKMFDFVIEAVIGEKTDPIAIQDAIAYYLNVKLNQKTKPLRADELRQGFKAKSEGGKNKFFVILDDVWQSVDLEDIGLSRLPYQKGVDYKILLTSRDKHVCTLMGTEFNSIFYVRLLAEAEAQSLFQQYAKTSDLELHKIGEDIVTKCCGLPIAIKTLACTLNNKRKDAWEDALSRLQNHDIENVAGAVFRTSYEKLPDEETKHVFLMCGLFPEDFNISTEELMRYGWGLKIFHRVHTIREARNRLNTCTERLIQTNLLIEGEDCLHVKMHDLVRDFLLGMFSEVEHLSVVNHGNMCGWPENDTTDSCKSISLTCNGMFEFPRDLKFPNLMILKLMDGHKHLNFPEEFYEGMEKLQVLSYDKIKYPLLPSSPQCSSNLRVFHLHACSLKMFDCSSIGNLLNLEVLSFANSGIEWLPSTIGNLKRLRLLDLTNCKGLHIDTGILRNLVKLEELYMRLDKGSISFIDKNHNEMEDVIKNLSTLEFDFYKSNVTAKNISFKKLRSFKIAVGHYFLKEIRERAYAFENELLLVTNKAEVQEYKMNELFEKTEVLYLRVGDMDYLEELFDGKCPRPPQSFSFYNLRVLFVSECAELRYLFTSGVANTLSKLEYLKVCECDSIEELIHIEGSEEETITFPKLKHLSLCGLPKLLGLCHIHELPELVELELEGIPCITSIYPKNNLETSSLLKEEIVIPKLRKISVGGCDNLVNLFPCNPIPLLHRLEELIVKKCGSIEVLFEIDFDRVGEIGEGSSLRSIEVEKLGKLREVWRIKGADNSSLLISGFQAVESINIIKCWRFRNVFTPIITNFDLRALMKLSINDYEGNRRNNESEKSSQEEEKTGIISKEETSQVTDSISKDIIPYSLSHSFQNLRRLYFQRFKAMEVFFETQTPISRELIKTHNNQQRLLPNLEELDLIDMDDMSHVWKCNKFLILRIQQPESPFHNLMTIYVARCKSLKYLFSPLMAKLLSNLKEVCIRECRIIEEVVSNRDNEDEENTTFTSTSTSNAPLFPRLDSLHLFHLHKLKCIGGSGAKDGSNEISLHNTTKTSAFVDQLKLSEAGGFSWSLCQYAREIKISGCSSLSSVIPCYAAGQMQKVQVLTIYSCSQMKEVFESSDEGMSNSSNSNSGCDEGIPRLLHNNVIMLPNLKILHIQHCNSLEHIFTFSALESLKQLEELMIECCRGMKVIVKEEEGDGDQTTTKESSVVVFPRLKSIDLIGLPKLAGFFLGKNEFRWPSLDKVTIKECPNVMVFAAGGSLVPRLKYICTSLGKHSVNDCGLNFHVTTAEHDHQIPVFPSATTSELGTPWPWSFRNLIELNVQMDGRVEKVIPSNELLQLQKLEKIRVYGCPSVEEVFEALDAGTNSSSSGVDDSQTILVKLPNLTQVELEDLRSLRCICKSNQWTLFEFPNLTTLHIKSCYTLKHVFTSSMAGNLLQLQELHISWCHHLEEVIVKDENEIMFPRLKSLKLSQLPRLKGFCLGKGDFSFPLLDTMRIWNCPEMTFFTKKNPTTPRLKEIETYFRVYYAGEGINSFIKARREMD